MSNRNIHKFKEIKKYTRFEKRQNLLFQKRKLEIRDSIFSKHLKNSIYKKIA